MRSFPATIPPGRSYVQDDLPRLVMTDYDYRFLADLDDDLVLIEWDMAVGQEELETFIGRAAADRDNVIVAPYRLYEAHSGKPNKPAWAQRRLTHNNMFSEFIRPGDEFCHLFGFGLVYLPIALVRAAAAEVEGSFNDTSFSSWHYFHAKRPNVPLQWDCRPSHVHYNIAALAERTSS